MSRPVALLPASKRLLHELIRQPAQGYLISAAAGQPLDDVVETLITTLIPNQYQSTHVLRVMPNDKQVIALEAVRKLRNQLSLRTASTYAVRVVLLHQAESMTHEAANALLKTLEEPPERTIILATTYQPARIIATIRSRLLPVQLSFEPASAPAKSDLAEQARAFLDGNLLTRLLLAQDQATAAEDFISTLIVEARSRGFERHGELLTELINAQKYLQARVNPRLVLEYTAINSEDVR